MKGGAVRIVLVLGGGNALGAYEVGAYAALEEAGYAPSWIAAPRPGRSTARS